MASKAAAALSTANRRQKLDVEEEEDVNRPPESSDSEEENRADIKPTIFKRTAEQSKRTEPLKQSINSNRSHGRPIARPRRSAASSFSGSTSSPKRKSQDDPHEVGKGMEDELGFTRTANNKKKRTATYKSSFTKMSSSQQSMLRVSQESKPDTPEKKFEQFDLGSSFKSDNEGGDTFKTVGTIDDSPTSSPLSARKFRKASLVSSPDSTPGSGRRFNKQLPASSPLKEDDIPTITFKKPDLDLSPDETFNQVSAEMKEDLPRKRRKLFPNLMQDDVLDTQQPALDACKDIEQITGRTRVATDKDDDLVSSSPMQDHDGGNGEMTQTQRDVCPMCNQPVDPADLEEFGSMNTRMQEKFCRMHQRKTAVEDWSLRDYPSIEWDNIDSRVSEHHRFVRQLINGADSHYRDLLSEAVDSGKDRNLSKMTSNLTPGYYGPRGLRIISENLMKKFTPLLKRRSVQDRLISARGVTGYVQAVLVLEVAALLIKEDMNVDMQKAREILADSTTVGELVNEELRERVQARIEDSEEDIDGE